MLLLSYYTGETLGCINLSKAESIIVKIIHMDSINFVIDNIPFNISSKSIFSSLDSNKNETIVTIDEILDFEHKNRITGSSTETILAQLIMLYTEIKPNTDFFSYIKQSYLEYQNRETCNAIESLP